MHADEMRLLRVPVCSFVLKVICSNERIMVWPFVGSKISGDGVPEGAMDPPTELSKVRFHTGTVL